jgi:hypothetical protein
MTMKTFWKDRVAIAFAATGIVLMVLTVIWRVNPVEGSVVPRFITGSPVGRLVLCVLYVTCMSVWFHTDLLVGVMLGPAQHLVRSPRWLHKFDMAKVVLPGIMYLLIGKPVSLCVRKLAEKRSAPTKTV